MGYWQALSVGLALSGKIMMVVAKYRHMPKKRTIKKIMAKLNETLDEMVIE